MSSCVIWNYNCKNINWICPFRMTSQTVLVVRHWTQWGLEGVPGPEPTRQFLVLNSLQKPLTLSSWEFRCVKKIIRQDLNNGPPNNGLHLITDLNMSDIQIIDEDPHPYLLFSHKHWYLDRTLKLQDPRSAFYSDIHADPWIFVHTNLD